MITQNNLSRKALLGRAGALMAVLAAVPYCDRKAHAADPLTASALDCVGTAEECLTHCLESLSKGDDSLKHCAVTVRDTITACEALAGFAAAKSAHLAAYIPVCKKICEDCLEECKKHAGHHEVCKRCADACQACINAMNAVA